MKVLAWNTYRSGYVNPKKEEVQHENSLDDIQMLLDDGPDVLMGDLNYSVFKLPKIKGYEAVPPPYDTHYKEKYGPSRIDYAIVKAGVKATALDAYKGYETTYGFDVIDHAPILYQFQLN